MGKEKYIKIKGKRIKYQILTKKELEKGRVKGYKYII